MKQNNVVAASELVTVPGDSNSFSQLFKLKGLPKIIRYVGFLSLFVMLAVAGGLFARSPVEPESETERLLEVDFTSARAQNYFEFKRDFLGRIESARDSNLGFELNGLLKAVHVDEGDEVRKGQLLAELDTEVLQAQLLSLVAQVKQAQAVLDELQSGPRLEDIEAARAEVRRWKAIFELAVLKSKRVGELQKSRAVSDQEIDEAKYHEQSVKAQYDRATATLQELVNGTRQEQIESQKAIVAQLTAERELVAIQIRKSQIVAPFTGLIASRMLDEGEIVQVGQSIFSLIDDCRLEARFGVPVTTAAEIRSDRRHRLRIDGRTLNAKIKSISPRKNVSSRTVDIVFSLPHSGTKPTIGDSINLEQVDRRAVIGFWIPTSALVENYRGLWGCYVAVPLQGTNRAKISLRELELLYPDGEKSFVRGAVEERERIITSGTHRLVNNQIVIIRKQRINGNVESQPNDQQRLSVR